jgi:hypothetical protein
MEGIEREVEKGEGRRVAIGMDDEFGLFFYLFLFKFAKLRECVHLSLNIGNFESCVERSCNHVKGTSKLCWRHYILQTQNEKEKKNKRKILS